MSISSSSVQILEATGQKQQTQHERFEKVRTLVYPRPESASHALAAEVAALIRSRAAEGKNTVLGLATGSTPVLFYRELIRLHREEGLSFATVVTFNLDEYYGLTRDHPESYLRFMRDQLFDHVDLPQEQIHIPDGTVPRESVYDHCRDYEARIEQAGGLDLQILGIGRTGHIGFNEPGSAIDSTTRMITLDRVTRQDAGPDFMGVANVPRSAITMGVGTILAAKRLVLMAWGANKGEIVREAVEGQICDEVPASYLQTHDNATYLIDAAAASQLTRFRYPWLVGGVTWDEPMKKRAAVWLSQHLNKPILKLLDDDYNENGADGLLASTASGTAYEANIEIFNRVQNTITGWPGGKPGEDDVTRPQAAQPHPKRILVFSPEPADAIVGMGGTLARLKEQGHEVKLVFQTSGNLRVSDAAALSFARVLLEMAEREAGAEWGTQSDYAKSILEAIEAKGEFGLDPDSVRALKGLVLRGETRSAASACRLQVDDTQFLDLRFYELGRYRRFRLEEADAEVTAQVIRDFKPHSIFVTGESSDPSSPQAIAFRAFVGAFERLGESDMKQLLNVWLYSGRDRPYGADEIDMAVPLSPDQLEEKIKAIGRFVSFNDAIPNTPSYNRETAAVYDALGMAEYEAIEAFRRWTPPVV